MKKEKLLLGMAIIGIFILLFLITIQKPILEGRIIYQKETSKTTILKLLSNKEEYEAILFGKISNNLTNESVRIYGHKEITFNKTMIIIDKISCLTCLP